MSKPSFLSPKPLHGLVVGVFTASAMVITMVAGTPTHMAGAASLPLPTNTTVQITPESAPGVQCLDVAGGATLATAGAVVQQYACLGRSQYNQVFQIQPQGATGLYSISVQSSRGQLNAAGSPAAPMCVGVSNASAGNGTGVTIQPCAFSDSASQQLWSITPSGNGWRVAHGLSGRCLDVPMGSTSSGTAMQVYDCSTVAQQKYDITPVEYPTVGIVYQAWFDYNTPTQGCAGPGWADGPFATPRNSATVKSLSLGNPTCYSSNDPSAAQAHATVLNSMGVSFILIDDTNMSKTKSPADNPIYQASKQVTAGITSGVTPLKVTYVLSLTCWQSQCYNLPGRNTGWDTSEMVIWNDNAAKAEVEDIAARYLANPSQFQFVDGKPLLVFYVNQGNNVYCPQNPPASLQAAGLCLQPQYSQLTRAFDGPGNIIPSQSQFDPLITVGGVPQKLSSVFTVRYGVVAANQTNYADYDSRIWPYNCAASCVGKEAGYSAITFAGAQRSWTFGQNSLASSLAANQGSASYLIVNAWNEFSSTDEYSNHSYTLEPNTYSHTVPGDEASGDPWYFFNKYKSTLLKWR